MTSRLPASTVKDKVIRMEKKSLVLESIRPLPRLNLLISFVQMESNAALEETDYLNLR